MKIGNFGHELADERAAQERATGIATASKAVSRIGGTYCLDCGEQISAARRLAAPFAVRCLTCQTRSEKRGR